MKHDEDGEKARDLVKCKSLSANIDPEITVLLWWEYQTVEKNRLAHHIMAYKLVSLCLQSCSENAANTNVLWETGACCKHPWEDEL